ncbi:MAG: SDR family oxidoreductase [Pseudomonadota bacterium]
MASTASKIALVTGAGTGIGAATALALAGAGYTVFGVGRRPEPLERTVADGVAAGIDPARLCAVPTDVGDEAAVDALFEQIESRCGRLDVLFNNAGVGAPPVSIDELSVADWRRVVDVNLTGVFLCARAAFALMKRQSPGGGRIINNGSISATAPRPFSAPYTATKHAVTGLTKSLALDGRPHRIACGQLDIGNAASEMTEPMLTGVLQAHGEVAAEPRMDVQHVADAVVQMAGLPLESNVLFMTLMATNMPFVGRG